MKRMWTLLKKDIWTSFTDKTILLMAFTPAILAMIFRMVYFDPWMLILTTGLFNIVLVPLTDFPLLLVEEKERDTLSLLFRSGVTLAQFAAAKAVACLVVGELMAVVVFLIAGADMSLLPEYLLIHLAGVTALLPWGFLTGAYAKDQNSVNVYAAVSVVAVYVAPVFSYWNVAFGRVAEFLPTGILGVVLKKLQPMEGFMDVSLVWGGAVCAVWFLAGIASLFVIRKKRPFFPTLEAGTRQR